MLIRLISGAAGVAVVLFAFTWPNVVSAVEERWASPIMIGFLTALVLMFGVYLIFYGLTGDWRPRLRKLRDRG